MPASAAGAQAAGVSAPSQARFDRGAGDAFVSRLERFATIGSTNDVVRDWLRAGTAEVCVAVADEQTAGRGRGGRTWLAPRGAALLGSLGFRPAWLPPERVWQLGAIVALAMAEAGEVEAGLGDGTIRLKWPNDLVIEAGAAVLKLAGVLGETDGLGSADPTAVVGIGVNVDWPRAAFPPDLSDEMTSLAEAALAPHRGDREGVAGRSGADVDRERLLSRFLAALGPRFGALRSGAFDHDAWAARQLTNGRPVRLEQPDGSVETVLAIGVDPGSGALIVSGGSAGGGERRLLVGEIRHLRLAPVGPAPSGGSSAAGSSSGM
jgi:BirA family biotin operon repressor/biotin-[acetyl-CoA-carboxylase] ligase